MLKMHYRKYGAGPPLVILHGLFGSSDNWHSLAKRWGESFTVYTVDLRNHGASPHESAMSYSEMSRDLSQFLNDHNLTAVNLVGHSMGGKVAMDFATHFPDRISGLVVLDIGIHQTVGQHNAILQALEQISPEEYSSREEIQAALSNFITSPSIQQFLMKNILRKVDNSFGWKFNRDALVEHYGNLTKALDLEGAYVGPTLFLRGKESDYLEAESDPEILEYFPMAQLLTIEKAGHWLHADQPDKLFQTIKEFLV